MKKCLVLLSVCLLGAWARAEVRVFVQDVGGAAWIKYECTAGEVVRAFALNVSVDKGQIVGISDYFRGESQPGNRGYGLFPASFRDHITVVSGTNVIWDVIGYTPLAVVADRPADTLPGLNSSGATLEFGRLWDPNVAAAVPGPVGTLCSLRISERARVTVAANLSRGGVVAADPDMLLAPVFAAALVQPPQITDLSLSEDDLTIRFAGGELEAAPTPAGPWTSTENSSGQYTESVRGGAGKFFRVRSPELRHRL